MYIIALVGFAGSILFAIFGGIGLIVLPIDLIESFIKRPRPISTAEYETKKKIIGEHAQVLHEVGQQVMMEIKGQGKSANLASRKMRNLKLKEGEFRRDVMILEIHYKRLEDSYKNQGGNFILQIATLLFGILSYY